MGIEKRERRRYKEKLGLGRKNKYSKQQKGENRVVPVF